jgi:hypothetical protein
MVLIASVRFPGDVSRYHETLTHSKGNRSMASRRRDERESSEFGLKLTACAVILGLTFWAGHDPAGAAIVVRHIGESIASVIHGATQHASQRS